VCGTSIDLVDYANIPKIIGILVSNKMATLHELQTYYGTESAYDLLEILSVDNHNDQRIEQWRNQS